MESIQYNAALVITGSIRGTSKEKLFEELDLESLQHRWWYRKLCCFCKILKDQSPNYLFIISPKLTRPYSTRNAKKIFLSSKLNTASSLRGSWWPSGRKCKAQSVTLGEWGCPLNNGRKMAVGQPNSSLKKLSFRHY